MGWVRKKEVLITKQGTYPCTVNNGSLLIHFVVNVQDIIMPHGKTFKAHLCGDYYFLICVLGDNLFFCLTRL